MTKAASAIICLEATPRFSIILLYSQSQHIVSSIKDWKQNNSESKQYLILILMNLLTDIDLKHLQPSQQLSYASEKYERAF